MASTSTVIHPLESQVGGHAGVSTIENGLLLVKPALPTEVAFYQRLQQDSELEDLRAFTPTFLGTLELMGKFDGARSVVSDSIVVESVASEEKDESLVLKFHKWSVSPDAIYVLHLQSIVLENLSSSFLKPNILDIKLGTVLYDKTASPEKVERMQKAAQETTSSETGVRLTGFQVSNLAC
jgi:1D-myo-inositol-tetrakisphosphate 5-kinase/inositol-polyphosphate multikinase